MQAQRQPWFEVSCCPPNVCRVIGSMGGRIASESEEAIWLHQYASCEISTRLNGVTVKLMVDTSYPWDGKIQICFSVDGDIRGELKLRIPGWCEKYRLSINGVPETGDVIKGYLTVRRTWKNKDTVDLDLEMPVVLMQADTRVREDCGRAAVMRGPIVYCIESIDNGEELGNLSIDAWEAPLSRSELWTDGTKTVTVLLKGHRMAGSGKSGEGLYHKADFKQKSVNIKAIPYFLWGNRGFGEMQVWIRANFLPLDT